MRQATSREARRAQPTLLRSPAARWIVIVDAVSPGFDEEIARIEMAYPVERVPQALPML